MIDETIKLAPAQAELLARPLESKIWLEGPAGSGKTTVAVARLMRLLERGAPAESILIFVPQRSLAEPYMKALRAQKSYRGGQVSAHTIGSLSLHMVEMFWFLVAEKAGFAHPHDLPNFLSLELVQYFMTRAIEPLIAERDYFNSVRIERARLYSQIVDNMNKAALVGFPINEIGARLKSALAAGNIEQAHIFADAQTCALEFRKYCLAHNLLDFSLYLEVFREHVLPLPQAQAYLRGRYKHVIADNVEEDTPASHSLLRSLLSGSGSALVVYDREAGFRRFLGADPWNARRLRASCDAHHAFADSLVTGAAQAFGARLARQLDFQAADGGAEMLADHAEPGRAVYAEARRYHPQMVEWAPKAGPSRKQGF